MHRIYLLFRIKQSMIYRHWLSKVILGISIAFILVLLGLYWTSQGRQIQVYITDHEGSALSQALVQARSEKINVIEIDQEKGLAGVKKYQAELLIVIPEASSQKIMSGQRQGIFEVYYLAGNQLAPFLADRLISQAFFEIYDLAATDHLKDLYQTYQVDKASDRLGDFRSKVRAFKHGLRPEYFSISFQLPGQEDGQAKLARDGDSPAEISQLGIVMICGGINFVFLLYIGLKLLYQADKNDRIRLAGFKWWAFLGAEVLVFILPQIGLFIGLTWLAILYQGLSLLRAFAGISIFGILVNLLLLRIVKDKQAYFSLGLGIYAIGIMVAIVCLQK